MIWASFHLESPNQIAEIWSLANYLIHLQSLRSPERMEENILISEPSIENKWLLRGGDPGKLT